MSEPGVLVTGASSGIGADIVARLHSAGIPVAAGVRTETDAAHWRAEGVPPIQIDVTDSAGVERAMAETSDLFGGRLRGVVNNAGIVVAGPLELVSEARLARQFEVNVLGLMRVTRGCIPLLRANEGGRIVNISSIAGRSATPVTGAYGASKFAVEALSDALRLELARWGIRVSLVEPGAVATPIWEKTTAETQAAVDALAPEAHALYAPLIEAMRAHVGKAANRATAAAKVTDAVVHALTSPAPRIRYVVGRDARIRLALEALPTAWRDRLMRRYLNW